MARAKLKRIQIHSSVDRRFCAPRRPALRSRRATVPVVPRRASRRARRDMCDVCDVWCLAGAAGPVGQAAPVHRQLASLLPGRRAPVPRDGLRRRRPACMCRKRRLGNSALGRWARRCFGSGLLISLGRATLEPRPIHAAAPVTARGTSAPRKGLTMLAARAGDLFMLIESQERLPEEWVRSHS